MGELVKKIVFVILSTFVTNLYAFDSMNSSMYTTQKLTVPSKFLDKERTIYVGLPPNYDEQKKYPVVYVLDGDYLFQGVLGYIQLNSYWEKLPEMIVVGVPHYGNRSEMNIEKSKKFYSFFCEELPVFIDSAFITSNFNTLVSHSYSGLFASDVLINNPKIFDGYLSISPALSIEATDKIVGLVENDTNNHHYFYISTSKNDLSGHIDLAFNAKKQLKNLVGSNFDFKLDFLEDNTHITLIPQSIGNGLDWIFQMYKTTEYEQLQLLIEEGVDIVKYIDKKYAKVEKTFGVVVPTRQEELFSIADLLIEYKMYDEAINFGKRLSCTNSNISYIGEGTIGQAYEMKGDYKKALVHYQKMYNMLPEDCLNKVDFLEDVKRVKKLIK